GAVEPRAVEPERRGRGRGDRGAQSLQGRRHAHVRRVPAEPREHQRVDGSSEDADVWIAKNADVWIAKNADVWIATIASITRVRGVWGGPGPPNQNSPGAEREHDAGLENFLQPRDAAPRVGR